MGKIKRAIVLCVVAMMSMAFLAGCALFARDTYYDNNQIVARVGNVATINKRTLRQAYNAWGFQFVTQQGMSEREAVERTLDILIQREILVHLSASEQYFGSHGAESAVTYWNGRINELVPSLTQEEYNRARRTVFDNMERNIRHVEDTVRNDRGIPNNVDAPPVAEEGAPVFTPHVPYIAVREFGHGNNITRDFRRNLDRFTERPQLGNVPTLEQFLHDAFQPRGASDTEAGVMRDVRTRIARDLRNAERGMNYRDDSEIAVIRREIERQLLEEVLNTLVGRFRDAFDMGIMTAGRHGDIGLVTGEDNRPTYWEIFVNRHTSNEAHDFWVDATNARNLDYVQSVVDRAREHYIRTVLMQIDRFEKEGDDHAIGQQILDGIDQVLWAPAHVAQNFFTVSHVLVGFNQQQQNEIEALGRRLQSGDINLAAYNAEVRRIQGELRVRERDITTGIEFGPEMTAEDVLARVRGHVGHTNPQRDFRDMIYAFGTDPGMQNPNFEYVIGVDTREMVNGERVGQDTMSRMVPEFTDESRRLHDLGAPGQLTDRLVWTQFGAHIIMYTRDVNQFINTNAAEILHQVYGNFLFQTQTSYGERRFFDTIVEQLVRQDYGRAERSVINTFKQELGDNAIRIYRSRFSDMW